MIDGIQGTYSTYPLPKKVADQQQPGTRVTNNQQNADSFALVQQQAVEEAATKMPSALKNQAEPSTKEAPVEDARQAFLDYMQLTTTEKMRAAILSQLDLTEEELASLPPEEREKIEAIIEERLEELAERKNKKQIDAYYG